MKLTVSIVASLLEESNTFRQLAAQKIVQDTVPTEPDFENTQKVRLTINRVVMCEPDNKIRAIKLVRSLNTLIPIEDIAAAYPELCFTGSFLELADAKRLVEFINSF